jgi:hypothetical protein
MLYSRIPHIQINWGEEPSSYADDPDNWIFLWKKKGYVGRLKWKKKFYKRLQI